MGSDWEQMAREILGDSLGRLTAFQKEAMDKLSGKIEKVAREGMREEIEQLEREIVDLKRRVAHLELLR